MNDAHVPLAAKALQNWKLNEDSDTLEITLATNSMPIELLIQHFIQVKNFISI